MKLGKLYESFTASNSDFLSLYQQQDLMLCETLEETKETIRTVFEAADDYAISNNLKHKYFELAKKPLWESLEIDSRHFILQGFDAHIAISLSESLDSMVPYIVVAKNDIEKYDITDEFIESLNKLQREIFLKELHELETETVSMLQNVWKMEQQRIDKWVKTSKVDLKGE
jgi:hypothetical protein